MTTGKVYSNFRVFLSALILNFMLAIPALADPTIPELAKSTVRVVDSQGSGTGFVVSSDGYIVTNNHVADGTKQYVVYFSGSDIAVPAEFIATDEDKDLTILRVTSVNVVPLKLATDMPTAGAQVWSLGYPGNADIVGDALEPTPGSGPFQRAFDGRMNRGVVALVQHGAPVNPGNSGGPLFDNCGRVIGVNTFVPTTFVDTDGTAAAATGIYFGTNISESIELLRDNEVSLNIIGNECIASAGDVDDAVVNEARDTAEAAREEARRAREEADQIRQQLIEEGLASDEIAAAAAAANERADMLEAAANAAALKSAALRDQYDTMQNTLFVVLPILFLGMIAALVFALKKPRERIVQMAGQAIDRVSRRVSPSSQYSRDARAENSNKGTGVKLVLSIQPQSKIGEQREILLKGSDEFGMSFGRHAGINQVVIDVADLSKRHFRLTLDEQNTLWLEDLNSTNGTSFKGQTLTPFEKVKLPFGASFIAASTMISVSKA